MSRPSGPSTVKAAAKRSPEWEILKCRPSSSGLPCCSVSEGRAFRRNAEILSRQDAQGSASGGKSGAKKGHLEALHAWRFHREKAGHKGGEVGAVQRAMPEVDVAGLQGSGCAAGWMRTNSNRIGKEFAPPRNSRISLLGPSSGLPISRLSVEWVFPLASTAVAGTPALADRGGKIPGERARGFGDR